MFDLTENPDRETCQDKIKYQLKLKNALLEFEIFQHSIHFIHLFILKSDNSYMILRDAIQFWTKRSTPVNDRRH